MTQEDQVEVLTLAMKNSGILDKSIFLRKLTKSGCKLTDLMTWQEVWKFWHNQSILSTNTQQIAKLRVIGKPRIQSNLEYVSTVITVHQRNKAFYRSIHQIAEKPFKELYAEYIQEKPDHLHVSIGIFVALKPFYVHQSSTKDIEMCCCKLHVHACWSINALLECGKLQSTNLRPVKDYCRFFSYLSENCRKESTTHLSWECVSNKKSLCSHSQQKWT